MTRLGELDVADRTGVAQRAADILAVSVFDVLGGLRAAFELLRVTPLGFISVESDRDARRIIKARWPDVVPFTDAGRGY
jgi:hypothetical protein